MNVKTESLEIARLRGASIFKIVLLGSIIGWTVFTSLFGVAALFGAEAVKWNEEYVTGAKGFLASPFIGAFIGICFGLVSAIAIYIGLRIYSMFQGLTLEYIATDKQAS